MIIVNFAFSYNNFIQCSCQFAFTGDKTVKMLRQPTVTTSSSPTFFSVFYYYDGFYFRQPLVDVLFIAILRHHQCLSNSGSAETKRPKGVVIHLLFTTQFFSCVSMYSFEKTKTHCLRFKKLAFEILQILGYIFEAIKIAAF